MAPLTPNPHIPGDVKIVAIINRALADGQVPENGLLIIGENSGVQLPGGSRRRKEIRGIRCAPTTGTLIRFVGDKTYEFDGDNLITK